MRRRSWQERIGEAVQFIRSIEGNGWAKNAISVVKVNRNQAKKKDAERLFIDVKKKDFLS